MYQLIHFFLTFLGILLPNSAFKCSIRWAALLITGPILGGSALALFFIVILLLWLFSIIIVLSFVFGVIFPLWNETLSLSSSHSFKDDDCEGTRYQQPLVSLFYVQHLSFNTLLWCSPFLKPPRFRSNSIHTRNAFFFETWVARFRFARTIHVTLFKRKSEENKNWC